MSARELRAALRRGPSVSPFLVLGHPTPELSVALAGAAVEAGAGMLEIGFPYSDPVADGPAIQAAAHRALAAGVTTRPALGLLARIAAACPRTPLNLLVYGNLVHRLGYDRFAAAAADAGASSLLVPDIPVDEAGPLRSACRRAGLAQVELAGPLTPPQRLRRLARVSEFLYLAGFQGVTGVRAAGFAAVLARVRETAAAVAKPICLGFGISDRTQVTGAFAAGARIAVVGSHLARLVEESFASGAAGERLLSDYAAAVRALTGRLAGTGAEAG